MKQDFYPHLEIQIVEHCNLNCASCTHFSPLAEPEYISTEDFFRQLALANRVFDGHCKSLKIMGGEPLLHPELTNLLFIARKAMPRIKITLQTNGILLPALEESFWKACYENDILIRVTRYPVKLDIANMKERAKQYKVNLKYHPDEDTIKSFNLYPLNLEGNGEPVTCHAACRMKQRYVLIKKDRLYPCPIVGNAEHFNQAFGDFLNISTEDSIDINEIDSFEEYERFAMAAIPFCRYCQPEEHRRDVGWKHSDKKIEEWA